MPGQLFDKMNAKRAEELHRQGAEDYRGSGLDFFPVRHPYGSPGWLAWSGGVAEAYEAEQAEEKARQTK